MTRHGHDLASARKKQGLTQEQLAEKVDVDVSTVRRWERGTSQPSVGGRQNVAIALQMSLAELDAILTGDEGPVCPHGAAPSGDRLLSQQDWLRVRASPGARGRELSELAAWLYPESDRTEDGHLLAGPGWLLEPVEIDSVELVWDGDARPYVLPAVDTHRLLPLDDEERRYLDYSRAVRDLVRPRLLENRKSYRLTDIHTEGGLRSPSARPPSSRCSTSSR